MPPVISLKKSELLEFAQTLILANTPLSLFKGLVTCSGMDKLRKYPDADLKNYYDYITARAGRSEVGIALAYAVMCAIVLKRRESSNLEIDASRLAWGGKIWEFMKRSDVKTSRIILPSEAHNPIVSSSSSASADTKLVIFGADGQPASWEHS